MADDPCSANVGWSIMAGAGADSTLAGVLAGFLIVAATALLAQWNDRSDPDTFALFASGVPALTLSSYLFTVLAGSQPVSGYCGQMWGQWLSAFALLLIGAAVLLCGLGWALVSYSDNLAVKLLEINRPMERVEKTRRFFISLCGCLSLGGTTAMTCWLLSAAIVYLKATTTRKSWWGKTVYPSFEFLHIKWYEMFFVFLFGLYVVVRTAYLVISRTLAARRENVASCIGYTPRDTTRVNVASHTGPTPAVLESRTPLDVRKYKRAERARDEICIAVAIALLTLLAVVLTRQAVDEKFSVAATWGIIGLLLGVYIIARLAYCGVVRFCGRTLPEETADKRFADADARVQKTRSLEKPEDAIRIKYSLQRLGATSYHVVIFAIVGTLFAAALTQGSFWPGMTTVSLWLGGLYPACMFLGLSYAVPGGSTTKLPAWKTWRGWSLLP
ncbi:MAG TPA: hypothetical protein VKI00_01395 [Mycobacterium sp.]|uniref:hypothetical protein n=1 Tax=Mycobacterium sp. TaxID=1785 RepID=UPI002D01DFDF|nr:hypothetical protein [Mycobacterium sp.]HME74338.1 hypothetical protein [Mycobacterium sp.]